MQGDVFRTPEAGQYLGLAASTLEKLRVYGGGPRFIRLGSRAIRYRKQDLDEWLEACARRSTSDAAGKA
jgi:excisionase family DNA binding protein